MRINVYTEELPEDFTGNFAIVYAEYVSSLTGEPTRNYGLRIFLKSHPDLHHSPQDDDRTAITFWCGPSLQLVRHFADVIQRASLNLRPEKA